MTSCKEWNTGGHMAPLTDINPYGGEADGVWFNRVHTYEHTTDGGSRTVHFPRSCLHCAEPACVTVCPTGASYKRSSDGIVLVDEDKCIGCKLCSWACPYGAREFDTDVGVMKKCTLVRRSHLQREYSGRGPCAGLRRRMSDGRTPFRRSRRSGLGRVATVGGARRRRADAGARLSADQPLSSAHEPEPHARDHDRRARSSTPHAEGGFLGWLDRVLSR